MDLRTTGFESCPEMVIKAVRHGLRMTELPIRTLPDRRGRAPHLRTVPDGWRHFSFILMCSPNWLFIAPGIVLLLLGIAEVTWLFLDPHRIGNVQLDSRAQLFGVLLAVLGFQIASIGLFARLQLLRAFPREGSFTGTSTEVCETRARVVRRWAAHSRWPGRRCLELRHLGSAWIRAVAQPFAMSSSGRSG